MGRHEEGIIRNMNNLNLPQERIKQISESRGIKKILFICLGNLCRSPMAEYMLRDYLNKNKKEDINISSAAFLDQRRATVPIEIYDMMCDAKINISDHKSKPFDQELIKESDLIIVMEIKQKEELSQRYPEDVSRIFLLSQFDEQNPEERDIADPMGQSLFEYRTCFDEIKMFTEKMGKMLANLPSNRLSDNT